MSTQPQTPVPVSPSISAQTPSQSIPNTVQNVELTHKASGGTAFKTAFFGTLGKTAGTFLILFIVLLLGCCLCGFIASTMSDTLDSSNSTSTRSR